MFLRERLKSSINSIYRKNGLPVVLNNWFFYFYLQYFEKDKEIINIADYRFLCYNIFSFKSVI